MAKRDAEKQLEFEKQIVKPFEFTLKINDNIVCQRYFIVKKYNKDCRESLEIKEMMDDIMGVRQHLQLGLIPEFFKQKCVTNSYIDYYTNSSYTEKDDYFSLEVLKNNVRKLRDKNGDFDLADLKKEVLIEGGFNGNIFHPNTRYIVDIRSIIHDIMKVIQKGLSHKSYTKTYGGTSLKRHNKLSQADLAKIEMD